MLVIVGSQFKKKKGFRDDILWIYFFTEQRLCFIIAGGVNLWVRGMHEITKIEASQILMVPHYRKY